MNEEIDAAYQEGRASRDEEILALEFRAVMAENALREILHYGSDEYAPMAGSSPYVIHIHKLARAGLKP
jgi:hypothetical protein